MKLAGSSLTQAAARLFEPALRNVEYFQRRLTAFAIIGIIAFPLYYYVWHSVFPQPYESLTLRLIGSALFIPLVFSRRWPAGLKPYLPYYWYFSLLYSLPFFFTFMLLKNNGSDVWVGSALVAVFVMILLLDWITLIAHFVLGTGLAIIVFKLSSETSFTAYNHYEYLAIALFAVVAGAVSNYDSERIRIEQERAMLATAGSIAHELRTPLLGIRAGASGLDKYLPTLIDAYRLALQHGLPVTAIRTAHLDALKNVLDHIDAEARHSNAIIDMLLVNARATGTVAQELVVCSMSRCVEIALQRYPYSEDERALVSWRPGADFKFRGAELLMVHVLFNLVKNALRHIGKAGKGEILIRIAAAPDSNRLIVHDTGGGISPQTLPHIFRRFYTSAGDSDSVLGTGIGLAFCRDVMGSFGGTIECSSVYGEFSEFVLTFPQP
ncbi:MAG: HAMP domain-containing sensor histidine kinase [Rhodocyclales bacterium]|nr:HAMP domain-containing sensor histidine kinase [Rhodocyclales bacterium]